MCTFTHSYVSMLWYTCVPRYLHIDIKGMNSSDSSGILGPRDLKYGGMGSSGEGRVLRTRSLGDLWELGKVSLNIFATGLSKIFVHCLCARTLGRTCSRPPLQLCRRSLERSCTGPLYQIFCLSLCLCRRVLTWKLVRSLSLEDLSTRSLLHRTSRTPVWKVSLLSFCSRFLCTSSPQEHTASLDLYAPLERTCTRLYKLYSEDFREDLWPPRSLH